MKKTYAASPESVTILRHDLDQLVPQIESKATTRLLAKWQEIKLAATELATNCVRHGCHELGSYTVSVYHDQSKVRVELANDGERFQPTLITPPDDHPGGRGLLIVDALADKWGVNHEDGTMIWFVIETA